MQEGTTRCSWLAGGKGLPAAVTLQNQRKGNPSLYATVRTSITNSHVAPRHTPGGQFFFKRYQRLSNKVQSLSKSLPVLLFRTAKCARLGPLPANLNTGKLPPCCGKSHALLQDTVLVTHPTPGNKRLLFHRRRISPHPVADSQSVPCQKSFKNRFMPASSRRSIEFGTGHFRVPKSGFIQSLIYTPLPCLPSV